jgi:hypothetical protein
VRKTSGYAILLGFMLSPFAAVYGQVLELDRLAGKDLAKRSANDLERLKELLGEVPMGYMMKPTPWFVWKTDHDGQTRYIVFLGEGEILIPGGSSARVQLFDGSGKTAGAWSFQVGWRIFLDGVSFKYSKDLGSDLIVLRTNPVVNGRDIGKEYFAISNDRLRLVRLENGKREITQNEYIYTQGGVNLVPDATNVDQFADLLESKDKADVLSALVFLGGRHLGERDSYPRDGRYAALLQELMDSPRISALIDHLSNSDDEWIRQASKLATRGPRERPANSVHLRLPKYTHAKN